MAMDKFGEVEGGLVIEGFVCGGEYFEVDSEFDWEPVEFLEDRSNVVSGSGSGEQAGSGVLNILEFFEDLGGDAVEEAVTVVESGGDEGVNEGLGSSVGEHGAEAGNVAEVKEGSLGDLVDMGLEGEGRVKEDTEVADSGGGGDSGAIDTEGEIMRGAGEGVRTDDEDF